MHFCKSTWVLLWMIFKTEATLCQGLQGLACCDGYMWSTKLGKCTKCSVGYTGYRCLSKCKYPTFGDNCQELCSCETTSCDFALGCQISGTESEIPLNYTPLSTKITSDKLRKELHSTTEVETSYQSEPVTHLGESTFIYQLNAVNINSRISLWIVCTGILSAVVLIFIGVLFLKCIYKRCNTVPIESGNNKILSPLSLTTTNENVDSSPVEDISSLQSSKSPMISMREIEKIYPTYEDVSEITGNEFDDKTTTVENYIEPIPSVLWKEKHSYPDSGDRWRPTYLTAIQ